MGGDNKKELWMKIDRHHLAYLQMEESPQKLEERHLLEDYIREYLSLVPHQFKFCTAEAPEVLRRSVCTKTDFSFYKAGLAFDSIGLYASNLISQPWRKEFREVRLFCGFFQHQVEAHLKDPSLLFLPMGYMTSPNRQKLVLQGPIDPERVAMVSRDCLIANVECQIMCLIWEELSQSFPYTMQEVLEFRENFIGDVSNAVQTLAYCYRQRIYQQHHAPMYSSSTLPTHYSTGLDSNAHYLGLGMPMSPYYCSMHRSPAVSSTLYSSSVMPFYPPMAFHQSQPQQQQQFLPLTSSHHVPTERLIDVDGPEMATITPPVTYHAHTYGHTSHAQPRQSKSQSRIGEDFATFDEHLQASYNLVSSKEPPAPVTRGTNGTWSDWGYVYKGLEKSGYNKDLGDRGDLLTSSSGHQKTLPRSHHVAANGNQRPEEEERLPKSVLELQERRENSASYSSTPQKPAETVSPPQRRERVTAEKSSRGSERGTDSHDEFMRLVQQFGSISMTPREKAFGNQASSATPPSVPVPSASPAPTPTSLAPAPADTTAITHTLGPFKVSILDSPQVTSQTERIREARVVSTLPREPVVKPSLTNDVDRLKTLPSRDLKPKTDISSHWICSECTVRNLPSCRSCSVCEASRKQLIIEGKPGPKPEEKEKPEKKNEEKPPEKEWECVTCTFCNTGSSNVCMMCGKSRERGPESKPLASGGKQCTKCTLVNKKEAKVCDACGTSLSDSATYV